MFELIQHIPEPWRQPVDVLMAPLAWIPRMQHMLWDFFFAPGPLWLVVAKYLFLVFPALLAIAAVWCTQLSLHVAVPLGARAVHPDDDADVVGCRARRVAVLGRDAPVRRGGAGMGGDVRHLRG